MIPDKLFFPEDGLPRYIDWDGSPIRTKQVEDSDICYIRKDALMEWAREQEVDAKLATTDGIYGIYYSGRERAFHEFIDKLNSM